MIHSKLRMLRHVRRFNFHNCNNHESVAEHSFFVALIMLDIMEDLRKSMPLLFDRSSSYAYLRAALIHDTDEAVLGDVPFLVRRRFLTRQVEEAARRELGVDFNWTPAIQTVVDFADIVELKLYLEDERRSGNNSMYRIEQETMGRMIASTVYIEIKDKWLQRVERVPTVAITEDLLHE